jgi:hypothetical protein
VARPDSSKGVVDASTPFEESGRATQNPTHRRLQKAVEFAMFRPLLITTLAVSGLLGLVSPGLAMQCFIKRTSLREDAAEAHVIVLAKLVRTKAKSDTDGSKEWTATFVVESVVHDSNATLKLNSTVRVPDHSQDIAEGEYLVFCDYVKGVIDPWRAIRANETTVNYLKGGVALDRRNRVGQMRYFFNYLEHTDPEIAKDAIQEFVKLLDGGYDFRNFGDGIPVAQLIRWVGDKKIPPTNRGYYVALLGHCGGDWGALTLRRLLDEPRKADDPRMLEGLLIGYTLLRPQNGWACILQIISDANCDFVVRYQALRAARFFREVRPSMVDQTDLIAGFSLFLQQPDIADLAIESLRRWGLWSMSDQVLGTYDKAEFRIPIVERSIIRYALECPKLKVKEFIQRVRRTDPERIEASEELLRYESGWRRDDILKAMPRW